MARTAKTTGGGTKGAAKTTPARKKSTASSKTAAAEAEQVKTAGKSSVPDSGGDQAVAEKKSGSGAGWLVFIVLLLVAGGGGYLTFPHWYPLVAEKLPVLPKLQAEDPRVGGLSERIAALESQTDTIKAKDETIVRLEKEREALSQELSKALSRLEAVEKSMAGVREMAEAAAAVDQTEQAKQSLQRLGDRLTALERSRGDDAAVEQHLAQLREARAQSKDLADRLARLEQSRQSDGVSGEALAGMEKRLAAVEQRPATGGGVTSNQAAIVLAVGQLRDAASGGGAYQRQYDAVKSMTGDDPGFAAPLMTLAKQAKTGVAGLVALRQEFGQLAGAIVTKAKGQTAQSWLGKAAARVGALVTVRRTEGGEPGTVETLVAAGEKQLAAGNLAGAVTAIEGIGPISSDAAAVVASWLGRAKTRLAVERALSALHIHAVSSLSAGAASAPKAEKE